MNGGQRRSNVSWKMTLVIQGASKKRRVAAQQKQSTYSFLGDVEEDGDDELRTTVQSQIRMTATLSTFGQKDSGQPGAVPLHCQDTQRVSAQRFIRPSIE